MPKKQKLHCLNFCFHAALGRLHHPAAPQHSYDLFYFDYFSLYFSVSADWYACNRLRRRISKTLKTVSFPQSLHFVCT